MNSSRLWRDEFLLMDYPSYLTGILSSRIRKPGKSEITISTQADSGDSDICTVILSEKLIIFFSNGLSFKQADKCQLWRRLKLLE
jgi:hypothetical protein